MMLSRRRRQLPQEEWTNWAGDVRFQPRRIEQPRDEAAVVAIVQQARREGLGVRAVGSRHSSNALAATDDVLIATNRLAGLESVDVANRRATVRAGMKLRDINNALAEHGLMIENLGDIDMQSLAGAVATGTHGSGYHFPNLSGFVLGGRLVTATGEVVRFDEEYNADLVPAARLALGSLGIVTALTIRLVPAIHLVRKEWCTDLPTCFAQLESLNAENRNLDYYWYPRSDVVKIRTWNQPGYEPPPVRGAKLVKEMRGLAKDVMGTEQVLRYHECEYSVPAEAGVDCLRAIRKRVLAKHRQHVGWRILNRSVAADDTWLSNAYGRPITAITLHQNYTLPCWDYFRDIEPIYRDHDGRPHWGKKHSMKAAQLRGQYPMWERFQEVRRRLDPEGMFLNEYTRGLLVEDAES